jgi:1,4-dihydroxy-2-naphthoate octaprenyltransferase
MTSIAIYFRETRPHFLSLTLVCVLVGLSTAVLSQAQAHWRYLPLALVGALAAHISVNVLNDHFDFRSGLDLRTRPTPFSGGSGILPAGLMPPQTALIFGLAALAVTAMVGIFFVVVYRAQGLLLLPLGVLGLLVVFFYTQHLTRSPWLCLVAPGLGFGPLMVLGTHFALTGSYNWAAFAASLVPGFLISDLLLLNQFPDLEADAAAGRRHILIVWGRAASARVYAALLVATYVWPVVAAVAGLLPWGALLCLLTLPLAIPTLLGVLRHAEELEALVPFLGKNVLVTLSTPSLLALGLFLSRWLA